MQNETYLRKTYAYIKNKQFVFNGHIKPETAKKRGFDSVTLAIIDFSGKGRSENRYFYAPDFSNMKSFF